MNRMMIMAAVLALHAVGASAQQGTAGSDTAKATAAARPTPAAARRGTPYFEFQVERQVSVLPGSPSPRYPEELRAAHVEGEVLAQFIVDESGRYEPGTLKIIKSSHQLFSAAVADALPAMRFTSAEIGGRRVRQLVQLPFTFSVTP